MRTTFLSCLSNYGSLLPSFLIIYFGRPFLSKTVCPNHLPIHSHFSIASQVSTLRRSCTYNFFTVEEIPPTVFFLRGHHQGRDPAWNNFDRGHLISKFSTVEEIPPIIILTTDISYRNFLPWTSNVKISTL